MPGQSLVTINADPRKGPTFADYAQMWRDRQKIVASGDEKALAAFDKDERTRNAHLGNMTQSQLALLVKYWSLTNKADQKAFLKQYPELTVNPREKWLTDNPKENAILALGGKAPVYTQAAYDEAQRLIKELDIPDSAVADFLPPKTLAADYFKLQGLSEKWGSNSAEVRLVLVNNPDLTKWMGRQTPDTPVKVLELQVKNRDLQTQYDALQSTEDKDAFKDAHPAYVADLRRVDAYNKGADDATAEKWVERGKLTDKYSPNSPEAKLWLVDNPDVWKWSLDNGLLTDDGAGWNVKRLRLDAQLHTLTEDTPEYENVSRQIEGYGMGLDDEGVQKWVAYNQLPTTGYRRDRFLMNDPAFAATVGRQVPDKVPSEQLDALLEKPDKTPADQLAIEAYQAYFPDELVPAYVEYYQIPEKGYARERYLKDNPDFYAAIKTNKGWTSTIDFSKTPTENVEYCYNIYNTLPSSGKQREYYRKAHPDLDEWLVRVKGLKPLGAVREPTTSATIIQGFSEKEAQAEEALRVGR